MNDEGRLLAIKEIEQLKARYFRFLDTKDWAGLTTVFAPDAIFDLREVSSVRDLTTGLLQPPPGTDKDVYVGRAAVIAMIRNAVEHRITIHHGHMPEIEITGEADARGIWAMEDVILNARGDAPFYLHGYGHYHDTYVRLPEGWSIRTTQITRLFLRSGEVVSEIERQA